MKLDSDQLNTFGSLFFQISTDHTLIVKLNSGSVVLLMYLAQNIYFGVLKLVLFCLTCENNTIFENNLCTLIYTLPNTSNCLLRKFHHPHTL